jgi:phospholipase C
MSFRAGRVFDRVLVVMFENQYRSYVLQNPYFRRLADQGVELGNYSGVMHPSQTNYIAAIAGELCGVIDDDPPLLLKQRTIVDLLEEAPGQLRWKGYMESFDPAANRWSRTLTPADACPYYVKHNPFALFERIVRRQRRWELIDSDAGFFADVLNNDLPEFAWFTPNIWSDGH